MKSTDRRVLHLPPGAAEANETIITYVSDRSVTLILREPDGRVDIASGVAVMIGFHYLVATAAHNVEEIDDDSQVRVVPRGLFDHPSLPVLARSHSPSEPDVAWLEIEAQPAMQTGLRFAGLDDLLCGQRHDPQVPFLVQGFPAAEVVVVDDAINPFSLGLLTSSVESETGTNHLLLEYPPQSAYDRGLELVEPPGISGGGIWLYPRFDDSPIWSAERAKLVAIARSWSRANSRLRTEPIERWLELVARDFPDVRDDIYVTHRFI